MIFAVPPHTEPSRFDVRETETNGFAQSCGVDVWDPVLVTDPPVGEVEALPGHISFWVLNIVCRQPAGERGRKNELAMIIKLFLPRVHAQASLESEGLRKIKRKIPGGLGKSPAGGGGYAMQGGQGEGHCQ
jgi:hypothetical protein